MTTETVTRGRYETRALELMREASVCSGATVNAVIELGRIADAQQEQIDTLAREVQRLSDRFEPRPPVAREQMRLEAEQYRADDAAEDWLRDQAVGS